LTFTDTSWGTLPKGYYIYAVKAVHTNGNLSNPSFSGAIEQIIDNEPLNVTFSSFSAMYSTNEIVSINWATASENNLRGFNVMRGHTDEQCRAFPINNDLIIANNTTVNSTYGLIDRMVEPGETYYYWIQVVDNSGILSFHGPRSVEIPETDVQILPETTVLNNVFPNPMRARDIASFGVAVKEGETANLKIFNIRGQLVKEFSDIKPGANVIDWNGRDRYNREVAAGIYFYRLTSPSVHSVQRLVLIK
jgi:hypothetical protein